MSSHEPILLESNQNHATITDNGICTTLSASMGLGGGYIPMIVQEVKNEQRSDSGRFLQPCSYGGGYV